MTKQEEKQRRMDMRRRVGNRRIKAEYEGVCNHPATPYLIAHACFECRKAYKRPPATGNARACPQCGEALHQMGRSFKPPEHADVEQWRKVQALYAHGFRFFSYRSFYCEPLPTRLRDVEDFVRRNPDHPFRVAPARPDLQPKAGR